MWLVLILLLALSAFFSASETSLASVNKMRLKARVEDGDKKAGLVMRLADDFDRTLSTILVGNNVVNIAFTSISTVLFTAALGQSGAAVATGVCTVLVLIFGEILPKSFAKENAERVALTAAGPLRAVKVLLTPFVWVFVQIKRLLTGRRSAELNVQPSVTEEELKTIIDTVEEEGVLDRQETDIIQSVIEFDSITAQNILVPRVDMAAVDKNAPQQQIIDLCVKGGYSRIPVYEDTIDNIVGILHVKDILCAVAQGGDLRPEQMMREAKFVYRTKRINSLLAELRREKQHMAIVIDEHGGTVGLVTMEDILEELVGEIWDETDQAKTTVCQTGPTTWQVSGDTAPEDLFEAIGFVDKNFDSDYATVGGWALEILEHIPEPGETFHYKDLDLRILSVADQRIQQVEVAYNKNDPEDPQRA